MGGGILFTKKGRPAFPSAKVNCELLSNILVYRRMLLKFMLEKKGLDSTGSGCHLMAGFCEHRIGLSDFINVPNFLTS